MKESFRNLLLKLAGDPYIWGGSNPWSGLDCSGFACWVLQVFGVLDADRYSADMLCRHFAHLGDVLVQESQLGDLAFYSPDGHTAHHVMVCLGGGLCIGASGGDDTTTSFDIARRQGAAVKVKPIRYRSDFLTIRPVSLILDGIEAELASQVMSRLGKQGAATQTVGNPPVEVQPRG